METGHQNEADLAFEKLLQETETRVRHSAHAHWMTTNRLDDVNRFVTMTTLVNGVLISIISALPYVYRSLYETYRDHTTTVLFLLGTVISISSVLQVSERWGERAQAHHHAAQAYSTLRRDLEILRLNLPKSRDQLSDILQLLKQLGESSPAVPASLWKKAVKSLS